MSRLPDADDGHYDLMPEPLWQQALKQGISSRVGQARLRRLEAALLALPKPRLVADYICEDGDVCVVGALMLANAVKLGTSREDWMSRWDGCELSIDEMCEVGVQAGMTYTLSWELVSLNDDVCSDEEPEERYDAVLNWVQARIKREVAQ